jgi:hypothetical protein
MIFSASNPTKSPPPTNCGDLGFQLSSDHEDSTNAFVSDMSPECRLSGGE